MIRKQQQNLSLIGLHITDFHFRVNHWAISVFVIMDLRYLGAFLLPTLYGFILFSCAIGSKESQICLNPTKPNLIIAILSLIFWDILSCLLMIPGIPALVGMAPSPPINQFLVMGQSPDLLVKY